MATSAKLAAEHRDLWAPVLDDAATQRDTALHPSAHHLDRLTAAAAWRTAPCGGCRGNTEPPPTGPPTSLLRRTVELPVHDNAATQRDAALHAPGHDPDRVTAAMACRTASSGGVAATRSRRRSWRPGATTNISVCCT